VCGEYNISKRTAILMNETSARVRPQCRKTTRSHKCRLCIHTALDLFRVHLLPACTTATACIPFLPVISSVFAPFSCGDFFENILLDIPLFLVFESAGVKPEFSKMNPLPVRCSPLFCIDCRLITIARLSNFMTGQEGQRDKFIMYVQGASK
jgi:hypothetical protein